LKKKKKNLEVWKKKIEDRVGICIDWKLNMIITNLEKIKKRENILEHEEKYTHR
jgi:hypothetical protein